jgi:hypothetical protein
VCDKKFNASARTKGEREEKKNLISVVILKANSREIQNKVAIIAAEILKQRRVRALLTRVNRSLNCCGKCSIIVVMKIS